MSAPRCPVAGKQTNNGEQRVWEGEAMSRFARKERPPPGFEILEPILNALESELRESEYHFQKSLVSLSSNPNSSVAVYLSIPHRRVETVVPGSATEPCVVNEVGKL